MQQAYRGEMVVNTLMDDETAPIVLPELVWIRGHPTIADPEMRAVRIRRCIVCDARQSFAVACGRGLIVHLIDPADIHADPVLFDGVSFAEPETIAAAHAYWTALGSVIVRKPGDPADVTLHPRFTPCPVCNREAILAGRLPVTLPPPAAGRTGRGEHGRDATRR